VLSGLRTWCWSQTAGIAVSYFGREQDTTAVTITVTPAITAGSIQLQPISPFVLTYSRGAERKHAIGGNGVLHISGVFSGHVTFPNVVGATSIGC
jgi:hypothetical protein